MSITFCCRVCLGKLPSQRKLWLGKALPSLPDVLCWHFPSESCARTGFCQSAVAASLAPLGIHSFFAPQHPSLLLPCGLCLPDPWLDPEEEQISQSKQKASPLPEYSINSIYSRNSKFHCSNSADIIQVLCQPGILVTHTDTHLPSFMCINRSAYFVETVKISVKGKKNEKLNPRA